MSFKTTFIIIIMSLLFANPLARETFSIDHIEKKQCLSPVSLIQKNWGWTAKKPSFLFIDLDEFIWGKSNISRTAMMLADIEYRITNGFHPDSLSSSDDYKKNILFALLERQNKETRKKKDSLQSFHLLALFDRLKIDGYTLTKDQTDQREYYKTYFTAESIRLNQEDIVNGDRFLLDGALDYLKKIQRKKNQGWNISVIALSASMQEIIVDLIEKFELSLLFDEIIGSSFDDQEYNKADAMVQRTKNELEAFVSLGDDNVKGALACKEATLLGPHQIFSYGVPTGHCTKTELEQNGSFVVDSLVESDVILNIFAYPEKFNSKRIFTKTLFQISGSS